MDVLSKLLMSIDAVRNQIFSSAKRHSDDYYNLVGALDDYTLKTNDGGMASFLELRGFGYILTDEERRFICKKIERSLDGFLPKSGYTLQIVDLSDPELTKTLLHNSMKSSFEELKSMGIAHPVFTTDYLEFASKIAVWKKQYLVVYTSPKAIKKERKSKDSDRDLLGAKNVVMEKLLKQDAHNQVVFSTAEEKQIFRQHRAFYETIYSEFTGVGAIIQRMPVGNAISAQKQTLYGKDCPLGWEPQFGHVRMTKKGDSDPSPAKVSVGTQNLVEQVLSSGGTEEDLPIDVLSFGNRLFTTLSMVIPQEQEAQLKAYRYISSRIPRDTGYLCSFRLVSNPYGFSSYNIEQAYTGISAILPMTDNLLIRRARSQMKDSHDNGDKTAVYLQMTVTLFAYEMEDLLDKRSRVSSILEGWNRAKFRNVELDKTQGLFDALPGASIASHLKQTMENFADTLYQSPLFMDGVMYEGGYLHLFTEDGQPFPFEEHAAININYNVYICGTPGSGKSVLLTLLNLALLAKPKTNPKFKGEFPLMFDVDFGRTSFGMKSLLRRLVGEDKKHLFLLHDMTTGIESSINPHDLPLGRLTPTSFQKEMLVRFLHVLLGGVEKNSDGDFKILHPEMESMIKYMIDVVYDYRQEDASPRMFKPGEFKQKSTLAFLKKHGVTVTENYSYYSLADLAMKADSRTGYYHAMILRRYAVPRLEDYSTVLINNAEIGARYDDTIVGGKSLKKYFLQRIGEVMNEFQCFTRPTRVSVDVARMISIDIDSVCGQSDYRKAVFGSMCLMMFLTKRENSERSKDLYHGVDEIYRPYLERIDSVNKYLPGTFNIEEAHVLFGLFDDIMCSLERRNRKEGWGMRTLSQNLVDPSDEFFSMCSTVFVYSEQAGDEVDKRLKTINASREERRILAEDINNRKAFLYVKTKPSGDFNIKRLAAKLDVKISPGWLWASNSEKVDLEFLDEAMDRLGEEEGFSRVSRFFTRGSVRGYYSRQPLKDLASRRGKDSVFNLLMDELIASETPSDELAHWL
jgi:hypothetical protein